MMNIQLNDKRALVTASTGGIGFAVAKGLAQAGATVIVNGRSERSVNEAVARLSAAVAGASVSGVAADLSTAQGVADLVSGVGTVDILVNNAGIYETQDFFDAGDDVWDNYWQTNVMSGVRLSRALLPAMVESGWGRVVFVASESARNIPADMIHYGVSKTAQLALARGLAKRVAGSGVTVNSVLPGPTLSDGVAEMMKGEVERTGKSLDTVVSEFVMQHRPSSIIQRAASVEEVANMIVYVCSTQSSATTGAALRVDGGVVDDIV
jgi:NAD(P)-dependent dehydrogenase (short-subunit alcohol dehydrogenase family)